MLDDASEDQSNEIIQQPQTWDQPMMTSLWSLISRSDLDQRVES